MVKMKNCAGLLSVFIVFFAVYSATQDDVPRLSIQELKKMMDSGANVVLLDAQAKEDYDIGHIKGAIFFPWKKQLSPQDVSRLPKNKPIVTYCDCGPGESDSAGIASQLLQMGFANVKVLKDPSIQGWREAGYPMDGK